MCLNVVLESIKTLQGIFNTGSGFTNCVVCEQKRLKRQMLRAKDHARTNSYPN